MPVRGHGGPGPGANRRPRARKIGVRADARPGAQPEGHRPDGLPDRAFALEPARFAERCGKRRACQDGAPGPVRRYRRRALDGAGGVDHPFPSGLAHARRPRSDRSGSHLRQRPARRDRPRKARGGPVGPDHHGFIPRQVIPGTGDADRSLHPGRRLGKPDLRGGSDLRRSRPRERSPAWRLGRHRGGSTRAGERP